MGRRSERKCNDSDSVRLVSYTKIVGHGAAAACDIIPQGAWNSACRGFEMGDKVLLVTCGCDMSRAELMQASAGLHTGHQECGLNQFG